MNRKGLALVLVCATATCEPALSGHRNSFRDVSPEALARYHWRLADARSADDKRLETFLDDTDGQALMLAFSGDHGLSAYAGCNEFYESYRLENGRLIQSTDSLATRTLRGCTPAVDDAIMNFLTEGPGIHGSGTAAMPKLHLQDARGDRLEFIGSLKASIRFDGPGDVVHVEIDRHSGACQRSAKPRSCLSVRELEYGLGEAPRGVPGEWQVVDEGTDGFDELPDSTTDLLVRRFPIPHPRPGGSSFAYVRLDL